MLLKCSIEMMSFHMSSRRCSSFHMSFFGQLRLPPTLTRPICPVARWDAVWGILYTVYGILCMHGNCLLYSKVTFPNLPPAQGYASPSRKLVLLPIDHNYTVGGYICIHMYRLPVFYFIPELINNLICWNCKGCIGKSIGPVQYRFTIPSLLAQCHVAGSMPRCWLSAS